MSLSRKHFVELAEAIGSTSQYDQLVYQIKSFCKRHNRAFQSDKFDAKIAKVKQDISDRNNPYNYGNTSD